MKFSRHFNFANLEWPYFATLGCVPLVKIQIGSSNPKWIFCSFGQIQKWISNPLNPLEEGFDRFNLNPDFLDLKSKRSIGNGFDKSNHGERGLANNIVPSLLSVVRNSVTSRVFVVINPFLDLAFH